MNDTSARQRRQASKRLAQWCLLLPLTVTCGVAPSLAQQPWATEPPRAPAAQPKPKATTPPAQPRAPAAPKEETQARQTDAQLRQRIEQLEEQLADMQVTVGTLESFGRTPGAATQPGPAGQAPRGPAGGGLDQARLETLDTQIQALAREMQQLREQMRELGAQRRSEAPQGAPPPPQREAALPGPRTDAPRQPPLPPTAVPPPGRPGTPPREGDQIGRLIEPNPPGAQPPPQALPPAAAQAGSPKELYETAYGYLLQQDYGAAEVAFEEFLRRHPSDRLAADAQYWLGETLYVQRRFKPAGQSFLRVIELHKTSGKVPNSILKLALSLEQLGQKDCALFTELETRHPNAPADVKSKARALKQRIGC